MKPARRMFVASCRPPSCVVRQFFPYSVGNLSSRGMSPSLDGPAGAATVVVVI